MNGSQIGRAKVPYKKGVRLVVVEIGRGTEYLVAGAVESAEKNENGKKPPLTSM